MTDGIDALLERLTSANEADIAQAEKQLQAQIDQYQERIDRIRRTMRFLRSLKEPGSKESRMGKGLSDQAKREVKRRGQDGETPEQIAEAMDLPLQSVRKSLAHQLRGNG